MGCNLGASPEGLAAATYIGEATGVQRNFAARERGFGLTGWRAWASGVRVCRGATDWYLGVLSVWTCMMNGVVGVNAGPSLMCWVLCRILRSHFDNEMWGRLMDGFKH